MTMTHNDQIHYLPSIHVLRCCPPEIEYCGLWSVQDHTGYGLGRFGTKTGALAFAQGRANHRINAASLEALHDGVDATFEPVLEVEAD